MKKFAVLFVALLVGSSAMAQEPTGQTTPKETYQPNVRGSLLFAVGINALSNAPEGFELNSWGSKSVNLYYLYDINIANSKFSFHPGFGLGLEKYDFEGVTLNFKDDLPGVSEPGEVLVLDSLQDIYGSGNFKKSRLAANYFDVPLEFSYVSNKTNPKAGLKVVLGGKVGVLYGAHMKVKYEVGDDTRKIKIKRDYNLNPFRYSAHTRIGYAGFNLYFEYQLSDLFDVGEGPYFRPTETGNYQQLQVEDMNNWRVGLAIDLF